MVPRWQQIEELFHAATALKAADRDEFLRDRCGEDSIRVEVESLLAAHDSASSFIDLPAFAASLRARASPLASIEPGRRIGRFAIRGVLGIGGMGVVYEAEQDNPKRSVALKVLRAAPLADELVTRLFQREAQALARLEHAGIAAIHEAGSTDDGWHYVAMERVEGAPLTKYASERGLSIPERLELFVRVCEAVHYAHQRGVIHRDLKPSNILVTESGQPKVLDFGVARIVDIDSSQHTCSTQPGAILGTLSYMSPEQVRGETARVDTRSDVYSLGVVLYELLTNRLPFELRDRPLPDAARVICEQPVESPGIVTRAARGDLATIVLKALDKDASRRYESVAALAEDVARSQAHLPILARPPSAAYQVRKLIQRHRVTSAMVLAFSAMLLALGAWVTVLYVRAEQNLSLARTAQQRASTEAQTAESVTEFVVSLLESRDRRISANRDLTLDQVLERASERIPDALANEPMPRAKILETMSRVYRSAPGFQKRAVELAQQAVVLRRAAQDQDHVDVAEALHVLGLAHKEAGEYEPAEAATREALRIREARLAADDRRIADARRSVGLALELRGKLEEAEGELRQALEDYRQAADAGPFDVARVQCDLAKVVLHRSNRTKEAGALLDESIAVFRELPGIEPMALIHALQLRGSVRLAEAQFPAAREALEESIALREQFYGSEDPQGLVSKSNLAATLAKMGNYEAAAETERQIVEVRRRVLPDDHSMLASSLNNLASYCQRLGHIAEAEPLFRESVAIQRRAVGPAHEKIAVALTNLARCLIAQGKLSEAEALYRESLEMRHSIHGREHPRTARSLSGLGSLLRQAGRLADAEPLLEECLAIRRKAFRAGHLDIAKALTEIGLLRESQGKLADAEAALREAESTYAATPAAPSLHFDCRTYLARVLAAQDRCGEVEPQLVGLLAEAEQAWPGAPARRIAVQGILAECHIRAQRFEDAESLLLQAPASPRAADPGDDDEQQSESGDSRRALQRLVMLYQAWDRAEPGRGYDAKAAEWQAKLDAPATRTAP